MKKLFTLFVLLVAIVTSVHAGQVTYTYFKVASSVLYGVSAKSTSSPAVEGFVLDQCEFSLVDPSTSASSVPSAGSGQLKIPASNAKGLVISAHGKTITKIEMSAWKNNPSQIKVGGETLTCTDGKVTWTGSATSVTFYNGESSDRQFGTLTVTYDGEFLDGVTSTTLSSLSRSGYNENNIYSVNCTRNPDTSYGLSLNVVNGNSSMKLTNGTGKLTLKSIKPIASVKITWDDATDVTVGGTAITKDATNKTNTWTAANTSTYEVAFVNASSSGNHTPQSMEITFASSGPSLSVAPPTANAFTYVAGDGPSTAQKFTVSLANSEKAVSATLSSTNYEMSKTGEADSYTSEAFTDLANGSEVYVRLKAGLAKGTGYNGTLTFANDDVTDDVVVNLSGSVTGQTYTVDYKLNGGSGTAPTHDPAEAGDKFNLAAAPTKDFSTFAGWLCDADNQVYAAGAEYEMTAANTKFTAQWNVTTYSSTLDFAGETIKRAVYGTSDAPTGEKAFTNINTFLESGNMIGTSGLNNNNWEPSDEKTGFIGYKLKVSGATVKFMAKAGKKVTITFGRISAKVTLRKNGVDSEISANSGDQVQTVVSFDAEEDMLVEIVTSSGGTVTLNKIAIEDAAASTNVTVGETGFATIGLPYVSTVPAGVTAYTVTPTSTSKVTLTAVEAGATIPAYKGLIIVAEPGNYTFTQKITEGTSTYNTGTGLLATGAVTRNAAAAAGEFYYFAIINAGEKKVGFKKCAANATLAANKAYLPGALIPSGGDSLEISFDGETAINGIAESEANAEAPVKVVKNGQLFIGNYNVAGARIK